MNHMKNFTLFGVAILAALTLAACGKNKETPKEDPNELETTLTKPSVSKGENKWPEANFITEDMKYTGSGDIVYTEHIDGEEDGDQDSSWTVFYKDASLEDVETYIQTLKSKGFKYILNEQEPKIEFKYGMFSWEGKTDDDKYFVSIYIADHNTLTTAGDLQTNIEQNMYIRLSNYDLNKATKDALSDDIEPEIFDDVAKD